MEGLIEDVIQKSFESIDNPEDKQAAYQKQKTMMVDDFATKRAQLKGQLVRDMADECWKICAIKTRKKDNYDKYIQELRGSNEPVDMDFTPKE